MGLGGEMPPRTPAPSGGQGRVPPRKIRRKWLISRIIDFGFWNAGIGIGDEEVGMVIAMKRGEA